MTATTLNTTTERLDRDRVKLRVEVPEDVLRPAVDAIYRRWGKEIKVPGFRQGKVPRRVIDARVGPEAIRHEAFKEALPNLYREALQAEKLEPIAPPDLEVVTFEPGDPVVFEATVHLRPEIEVPDLASITVPAPSFEVTDEDVDEHLGRLRDRFAELETVAREATLGDHVLIDLKGQVHDQVVESVSTPDLLYELGSHTGPPRLDEEIEGNRPGAILKFTSRMPEGSGELAGQEISFTVLIKEIKGKRLPALDDEFAKTVGEFGTLEELKAELRADLAKLKKPAVEEEIRTQTLSKLVDAASFDVPDKVLDEEFEHRMRYLTEELGRAGISVDEYARRRGSTTLELRKDIRGQAARGVKAELLLEEVARRENIEMSREDVGQEIAAMAARSQRDASEVTEELSRSGRLSEVAADIMRRKALDYIVERANVIGRPPKEEQEEPEPAVEVGTT